MNGTAEGRRKVTLLKAPNPRPEDGAANVEGVVRDVIAAVRARKDAALREHSQLFDRMAVERFEVSAAEASG